MKNKEKVYNPEWRFPSKFEDVKSEEEINEIEKIVKKNGDYIKARYDILNFISNISLSVHPDIKKSWKINFELFGNPYNTQNNYCSLFPDENDRVYNGCNAYDYKPRKDDVILVNPPYTINHIDETIKLIDKWFDDKEINKNKFKIYFVIPIWDLEMRRILKMKLGDDFPAIERIKKHKNLMSWSVVYNFRFYDFFNNEESILKTPIYVMYFENDPENTNNKKFRILGKIIKLPNHTNKKTNKKLLDKKSKKSKKKKSKKNLKKNLIS